jgi:DNA recombination protein RmuC
MSVVGIVVVVAMAIFAASILGAWLRGGSSGPQGDIKGVHEEMQRLLTTQAQGISAQMGQVSQLLTQHLTEVRRELEQGVTTASQITADAQRDMTDQLRNSTETLNRLSQHLGEVQKSGQELTQAAQTMQAVLGGPKSHGVVGEAQLETLLADVLPKSAYEFDYEFSSGVMATAVLYAGQKLVAIDAEFPLDACRKVVEKGDEGARAEFAAAVRKHVDEVAQTFILPYEDTLDLALMFVPSESAFVELLLTHDEHGRLDDYCRQKHVLPVSPNSLHAYLSAILVGLKGMEFEENAKRMLAGLEDVKKQFGQFAQAHAELGGQLRQVQAMYEAASRRFASAQTALAATALAEPAPAPDAEESEAVAAEEVPVQASNNGA